MGALNNVLWAAVAGGVALGGYYLGCHHEAVSAYKVVCKDKEAYLYSRELDKSSKISVIEGRLLIGTAQDNLHGYDALRTREITDYVLSQMLAGGGSGAGSGGVTGVSNQASKAVLPLSWLKAIGSSVPGSSR